ncbi:hypothetical protein GALMADRAFT_126194 [Galerina marginata CBS 339.88]|uniref:F-box domain-containing protein n=1 Tax=Galerina marginata (strain CBS 339.88) TaxID=685588 RepID=A0A067SY25_GALM3|nr:hypothetical protein GALMADRAFT_126194 [Galerina marginata CBS 339.88]
MHSVEHITAFANGLASRLAPEICDLILDNIHDSKEDLSNCSVVCKSWLPASRYHLFGEVHFRPDLAQLISSSTHAATTIAPYIRKVTIQGNLIVQEKKDSVLKSILRLPKLTSLRVEKFAWVGFQVPVALAADARQSVRLLKLELRSVHFPSFEILAEFLDLFSALQELSLDNVSWDRLGCILAEGSVRNPVLKPSSLTKLHVTSCHNVAVLNWLQYGLISDVVTDGDTKYHRLFPRLVVLSLPDILPGEAKTLGVLLSTLGETLEHLDAGILVSDSKNLDIEGFSNALSVSSNSNLKSINIHQITLFQFPTAQQLSPAIDSQYAWLLSFMSTIRSTHFQSAGFHVWLSEESQLDSFPWFDLSDILLDIGVTRIQFRISGIGRDTELVEAWFTRRLGKIDTAKTSIHFDFSG